jgi:opacity protein-like surface antigen
LISIPARAHGRLANLIRLLATGLTVAGLLVPTFGEASEPTRHWGIGWDGWNSSPLLRWRPAAAWDLTLTAGPDDGKGKDDSYRFSIDGGDPASSVEHVDSRRESGHVVLSGGRRVWNEGRFALAGVLGLSADWSNTEDVFRGPDYDYIYGNPTDVRHRRESRHGEAWALAAMLRPSFALSSRFSVEFETGLRFSWSTVRAAQSVWYDTSTDYERIDDSSHDTSFRTWGRFDWGYLKFVFWL